MRILRNNSHLPFEDKGWNSGVHVDLGAGRNPRNPMRCQRVYAVDVLDHAPFIETPVLRYCRVSPGETLPFENESVDSVSAFDFLEHLPRYGIASDGRATNLFIDMMGEIWRILKPGGSFIAVTPCYPAPGTFVDPTHVNPIATGTVDYFSGPVHAKELGYGFTGAFEAHCVAWITAGHSLWRTLEPAARSSNCDWPLNNRPTFGQTSRQFVGNLLRNVGLIERPQHILWVLQRPVTTLD